MAAFVLVQDLISRLAGNLQEQTLHIPPGDVQGNRGDAQAARFAGGD